MAGDHLPTSFESHVHNYRLHAQHNGVEGYLVTHSAQYFNGLHHGNKVFLLIIAAEQRFKSYILLLAVVGCDIEHHRIIGVDDVGYGVVLIGEINGGVVVSGCPLENGCRFGLCLPYHHWNIGLDDARLFGSDGL